MIDAIDMKTAVSTVNEPYILQYFNLDWKIFEMNFDEWCQRMDEHLKSQPVQFTSGTIKHCDLPYWESFRTHAHLTFSEFAKKSKENHFAEQWFSHSYRDIISWPNDLSESISFARLGFDNAEDILFWLGSKGANTPCHYDTYGFNIVVQIYGKKSWLLFPPKASLTSTRVPFEESSVYCKQNFYSPADMEQFGGELIQNHVEVYLMQQTFYWQFGFYSTCNKNDKSKNLYFLIDLGKNQDAYEVNLNPGDILIVPANWWHYVENLDTSLTVNTWVPLVNMNSL